MAQKIEGNPAVEIHTDRDVTIDSNGVSVMAGAINDRDGTAKIKIDADGKVTLKSATGSAIQGFDKSGGTTTYEGSGDVEISINGRQGIDLISPDDDAATAVKLWREHEGNTELDIKSDEGDVNITGGNGFNLKGAAGTMTASVTGQNVHIASTAGAGIALDNSALDLKVNQPGGAITVDTPNRDGTAVKVSGSKGSLTFGDGKANTDVYVNGYVTVTDGATATFEKNTTTHVDSTYLTTDGKNFITTNGNSTVNLNGKLDVGKIATGTTLNFSNDKELNKTAAESIITDNVLQDIKVGGDGTMSVGRVSSEEAHKVLAGSLLTDVALYATEHNVDGVTTLLTGENDVEALNSAAGLSAMAGVEHGTYTAAGIFNDAVAGHLMNRNDEDVWAYGFHNKENVNGLSFGADYDAQYNGVVAGADLYRNGGTVAGIALSYADGNVSGSNGFASTQNDADYYGASLYARFDRGSYALLGDISYMKGDHDVTQWNKGQTITASPDSDAVSVGVKAVKDFTAGESGTLTPYIGVRYLRLSTDGFTASNGLHYEGDDQDLVLIPVGVNYSAAITGGSWTFRPYAGVGYVWNAGDKSTDQTVTLGTAADSFSYDTVDSGSFLTRVGFTADHGDMSYGVGYSYQKGDSVSNNAWTLSASFRF